MSLLALLAVAGPAGADNGATGTVALSSTAITSISVSPNTFGYDECVPWNGGTVSDLVVFPNGFCTSDQLVVTNGASPATIEVSATDFVPSDGTDHPWALCSISGSSSTCNGTNGGITAPGVDQVALQQPNSTSWLGTTPSRDQYFGTAQGGQEEPERLSLYAPSQSTDLSPGFSNTVTWIAVPS